MINPLKEQIHGENNWQLISLAVVGEPAYTARRFR